MKYFILTDEICYFSVLGGYESKCNPLEELHGQSHMQDVHHIREVHPQQPFYMPFLQRPVMSDSVYMTPFHYYPPPPVRVMN